MNKYVLLDELMIFVYSVNVGLSEVQAENIYVGKLRNIDYLNEISDEISLAFADENFSWSNFFDEHDIYTADSEDDAKKYAERIILAPLMRVAETIHEKDEGGNLTGEFVSNHNDKQSPPKSEK